MSVSSFLKLTLHPQGLTLYSSIQVYPKSIMSSEEPCNYYEPIAILLLVIFSDCPFMKVFPLSISIFPVFFLFLDDPLPNLIGTPRADSDQCIVLVIRV